LQNIQSNPTQLLVIIRIKGIYYIIISGYVATIPAIYRLKYYLLKKMIYTIGDIVVDCVPKHVAGSNSVKYTINPNNNY